MWSTGYRFQPHCTSTYFPLAHGTIGIRESAPLQLLSRSRLSRATSIVPTGVTVLANNMLAVLRLRPTISRPTIPAARTHDQHRQSRLGLRLHRRLGRRVDRGRRTVPTKAGVKPSAIASDPTNRFVYVTDYASSQLIGYTIHGRQHAELPDQRSLQDRQRALRHHHRSARQVHLCHQLAGFLGLGLRHRPGHRHSYGAL